MEKPDIVVGTPSVLLGHVQAKVSTTKNRLVRAKSEAPIDKIIYHSNQTINL